MIVITGDNKVTAEAICKKIGIFAEGEPLEGSSFTGVCFHLFRVQARARVCVCVCVVRIRLSTCVRECVVRCVT